jgi:hypothetical protein
MKIPPALIFALLLFFCCGATAAGAASPQARYRELVKIVDRNTGHAHFTRGMNRYTIMTAANVLMRMTAPGRRAVYETLMTTASTATRDIVAEHLQDLPYDETMKSRIPSWTEDIPLLKKMADSRDLRTIWAARDLLKNMGDAGRGAIREILATTKNQRTRAQLQEQPGR